MVAFDENDSKESKVPEFPSLLSNNNELLGDLSSPFQSIVCDKKTGETESTTDFNDSKDRQLLTPDLDSLHPTLGDFSDFDGNFFLDEPTKPEPKTDNVITAKESTQPCLPNSNNAVAKLPQDPQCWRLCSQSDCDSLSQQECQANLLFHNQSNCTCKAEESDCPNGKVCSQLSTENICYPASKITKEQTKIKNTTEFSSHPQYLCHFTHNNQAMNASLNGKDFVSPDLLNYYRGETTKNWENKTPLFKQNSMGHLQYKQTAFNSNSVFYRRKSLPFSNFAGNESAGKNVENSIFPFATSNEDLQRLEGSSVFTSGSRKGGYKTPNNYSAYPLNQATDESEQTSLIPKSHYPGCYISANSLTHQHPSESGLRSNSFGGNNLTHCENPKDNKENPFTSKDDFTFLPPGLPFSSSFPRRQSEGKKTL